MSKIPKILKIFGLVFLLLPILSMLSLFFVARTCGIGCPIAVLIYGFFSVLLSIILFSFSHVLNKRLKKEKILIKRSNNNLILRIIFGVVLVGLGFLFHYFKNDGLDLPFVIVGSVIILVYSIEFIVSLFSKKQNVSLADK